MKPTFNLRQLMAASAISAAAGYFAGSSCEPLAERIIHAREAAGRCEESEGSDMTRLVGLLAQRAVRKAAPVLRSELGAGSSGETVIEYTFSVGEGGSIALTGASASCQGASCPGESELPEMIGVLIASEWSAKPPGSGCEMLIRVEIPPLGDQAPPRRIRMPAGNRTIDL